jgi:S1-C subfamily serine protease
VRSAGFPVSNADGAGVPQALVSDGIVSKLMDVNGQNLIAHSAATAQGTSGGPLMDLCGRAVGINSYSDTAVLVGFSLAQPVAALLDFLKANGKTVAPDSAPCAPRGIAFGGPAAAAPATSAPSGPPQRPRG